MKTSINLNSNSVSDTISSLKASAANGTLTYRELRTSLPSTGKGMVPGIRQLQKSGVPIILQANTDDGVISIYANGFCTYVVNGRHTVFGVDRCPKFHWEFDDGTEKDIDASALDDKDWAATLEIIGMTRLEHNTDNREEDNALFSMNDDQSDDTEDTGDVAYNKKIRESTTMKDFYAYDSLIDPLEKLIAMEDAADEEVKLAKLSQAMELLTCKQRRIIKLYFYERLTQKEIATKLGLPQSVISITLNRGLQKIKRNL